MLPRRRHRTARNISSRSNARYRPFLEQLEDRQLLATFMVLNTNNAGPGSLRQALLDANALAGADEIEFNIPGLGVQTIQPTSPLPDVFPDPITIDGTTQPGFAGTPLIELDGSLAGASTEGLRLVAGSSAVHGLIVNRFGSNGISIFGGNASTVTGSYIGTDATGALARPNATGVAIFSANHVIGGTTPGSRNVISGNRFSGIQLFGADATGNRIEGNHLGTNALGTAAVPNQINGILINAGAQDNTVGGNTVAARNLISGNTFHGVQISDAATSDNQVLGNYLGTTASGAAALGNGGNGVILNLGATLNTVGGTTASARNVIAANGFHGVQIADTGTNNNTLQGNYIGTDATGTTAIGNVIQGVFINGGARNNTIGGTASGAGNVISGNRVDGVQIADAATTGNVLQGNFIGTRGDGMAALGNVRAGVLINLGANNNIIGGVAAGAGNLIRAHPEGGIVLFTDAGSGNQLRGNSFVGNGRLAIDLGWDDVTPNHLGGSATGPNRWQNYPVIRSATPGASTTITGTLNGLANTTFTLDFYASPAPTTMLFGPGQRYLGSTTVSTNASGNATFTATLSAASSANEWLSATATDPAGNTSEFSNARQLPVQDLRFTTNQWTALGPAPNSGSPLRNLLFAGRADVAAPHPTDPNIMYLAANGGGIWKTTNWLSQFPTWTPLTDDQPSLSFNSVYNALAVHPANPNLIYAAMSGPDGGILKSTDAGATWNFLANPLFDIVGFGSLALHPTNVNILYATVTVGPTLGHGGVYRSTDGGQTWTNTTASIHTGASFDVAIDPTNPQVLYAGLTQFSGGGTTSGVYKSTNGGDSWTLMSTGLPASATIGTAIRLALAPSSPQTVYASVMDLATREPRRFRTTNGGASWSALSALPTPEDDRYWHNLLAVDPTNAQNIFVNGDHSMYRSTNGGSSWIEMFRNSEDPVGGHFDATGAFVMVADRGIYRMAAPNFALIDKNFNLDATQFYTVTLDPTNPDMVYGIAQDYFSQLRFNGAPVWNILGLLPGLGGDGAEFGKVLVSPANPNRIYQFAPEDFSSHVFRSDDGGATWVARGTGIPNDAGFGLRLTSQKAFVMDPSNPLRLLVGTRRIYQTTNGGDSWVPISPVLSTNASRPFFTSLAISASAPNTIYAGTTDGRIWVTTNGGADWLPRDSGIAIDPFNAISDIEIDPTNPNRAFAVAGQYPTALFGEARVYMTINGGVSWTNISGNLPLDHWTTSLAVDWRLTTPALYVGTARGVYRSGDLGISWAKFGQGMPNAVTTDVQLLPQFNRLAASTYGRGVWEILVPNTLAVISLTPTATGFTATFNRPLDPSVLNLYDTQTGGLGSADVAVTDAGGNLVRGSLVIDSTNTRITFIQTGVVLAPSTYTVTLRSAVNGFKDGTGGLLDGNGDGTTGDAFTTTFTVPSSMARVVSIPDFARGPGQPVNVPATATGIPLHISDGRTVTSITLTLVYNPALLSITAATVASGVPGGSTVNLNTTTPGRAVLTFTSPSQISLGSADFVVLSANVPTTAGYTSKHILDITELRVNNGGITALDNDGIHVVGYLGDTTGNGGYSSTDALRIQRVAVGLDSGFAAYQLADPVVVADINGNGQVNSLDATRVLQEAIGMDRPEIPPLAGLPTLQPGGPDPLLWLPKRLRGRPGQVLTVPVYVTPSEGLESADLALSYDAQSLEVLDVRRGKLTADFDLFAVNVDSQSGTIRAGLGRTAGPISRRGKGTILLITFRVRADAASGRTIINLRQELGTTFTQLNEGGLVLNPTPSDQAGDALDGVIVIQNQVTRRSRLLARDMVFASGVMG